MQHHDWFDWLTLGAAVMAAIGTLLAAYMLRLMWSGRAKISYGGVRIAIQHIGGFSLRAPRATHDRVSCDFSCPLTGQLIPLTVTCYVEIETVDGGKGKETVALTVAHGELSSP